MHVTIFSTGGKLRLVSNFTEVHALTLAVIFLCTLGEEIEGEGKGGKGRVEEKEERKKGREVREGRREGGGQGGRRRSSLVSRRRAPPSEKRSGERSRIPWAYYPKRVMTNEIARLVIIT